MSLLVNTLKIIGIALAALLVVAVAILFKPNLSKDDLKQYWQPPSKFITLPSGATVHYRDQGKPDGPIVVLVHGQTASLHSWEPWISFLKEDYRIITADMPGHGLTGRIPSDFYSRGNMVKVFEELLTALAIDKRITLVGNSGGGDVSQMFTLENPGKVAGLVLIGAGGSTAFTEWETSQPYLYEMAQKSMNGVNAHIKTLTWRETLAAYYRPPGTIRRTLESYIGVHSAITEELVESKDKLTRYEGNRFAQQLMLYHGYADVGPEDLRPRLPEIQVPTLLMWGSEDPIVTVEQAHEFERLIKDTQLVVYQGVGHVSQIEIPERSANDLDVFMKTRIIPTLATATGDNGSGAEQ